MVEAIDISVAKPLSACSPLCATDVIAVEQSLDNVWNRCDLPSPGWESGKTSIIFAKMVAQDC